jgi:hypothetical protein
MGSVGGSTSHGTRFDDGHHRFSGRFRDRDRFFGGTYGYYPYDDYGYSPYDDYGYADNGACWQYQHVHTKAGWRWRQVWAC